MRDILETILMGLLVIFWFIGKFIVAALVTAAMYVIGLGICMVALVVGALALLWPRR